MAGWFRIAGFDLRTERPDGRQVGSAALGGRFKGHIDGFLVSGPVAMDYPALWENKALGAASWKDVVKRGVSLARPVYSAQIALYQAYMELPAPALFTALNRDTMELHAELVPFDAHLAQEMSGRAVAVVRIWMHPDGKAEIEGKGPTHTGVSFVQHRRASGGGQISAGIVMNQLVGRGYLAGLYLCGTALYQGGRCVPDARGKGKVPWHVHAHGVHRGLGVVLQEAELRATGVIDPGILVGVQIFGHARPRVEGAMA